MERNAGSGIQQEKPTRNIRTFRVVTHPLVIMMLSTLRAFGRGLPFLGLTSTRLIGLFTMQQPPCDMSLAIRSAIFLTGIRITLMETLSHFGTSAFLFMSIAIVNIF